MTTLKSSTCKYTHCDSRSQIQMVRTKEVTGEYKLLNRNMEKKKKRLAKDISENGIKANLKI